MSKQKFKLQPINVKNPRPAGASIPALPLPHEGIISRPDAAEFSEPTTSTAYTGISGSGAGNTTLATAGEAALLREEQESAPLPHDGKEVLEKDRRRGRTGLLADLPPFVEGKTRDVWRFLTRQAAANRQATGKGLFVRATRREVATACGIGSLETVDRALSRLQGLGFIDVERSRGANDGNVIEIKETVKHPESVEEAWQGIAEALERSAELIKARGRRLSANDLNQWGEVADRALRLLGEAGREAEEAEKG